MSPLPGVDAAGTARAIIERFGGVAPALAASRAEQARAAGGNAQVVAQLRSARELLVCAMYERVQDRPLISNWSKLFAYLRFDQGYQAHECARVLFLNTKNYLVADQRAQGSIDEAAFYVRDILRTALDVGAAGIILVHNHPSGINEPSESDISLTRRVKVAAHVLDVRLIDHVIVSRDGCFSFRAQNLL